MSTGRGMDKDDVVHIYNGILLNHKKNKIIPSAATWMDYHTKEKKSKREKTNTNDLTYMWNLKYDTNEFIYEMEIDSQT